MTGEEERGPYLTLGEHADAYAQDVGSGELPTDALLAANARIAELETQLNDLTEQVRLGEQQYAAAMRVNEQRRDENEHLRRLLAAVLPPDAVYQEARELARRLRGYRP